MSDLDTLKARLIKAKKAKAWPGIAFVTGISQRTMYNIINGKMPNVRTVEKLMDYLKSPRGKI